MKFEEKDYIVYCKDEYHDEFDHGYYCNNKCYWRGYLVHREDGPAVEWEDGLKAWWLNGERHRKDGPAIEYSNGDKEYWLNGEYYSKEEYYTIINLKKKNRVLNEI